MVALIWVLCFVLLAILQVFIKNCGITLGGIPTAVLFGLTWSIAASLSNKWKNRISKNGIPEEHNEVSDPVTYVPEEPNKKQDDFHPVIKHYNSKLRYCKLCGNLVDSKTKKCTKCGKQYFRNPLKEIPLFAIVLAIILCVTLGFFSNSIKQKQQEIDDLLAKVSDLESTIESRNKTIKEYEKQIAAKNERAARIISENQAMEDKCDFIDKYVVFVCNDNSRLYHKYDCLSFQISNSTFWAYNTEAARGKGFKPCSKCFE